MRVLLIALTLVAAFGFAQANGTTAALPEPVQPWYWLLYDELRAWQTFLAAVFGFAGLIVAARHGFRGIKRSTDSAAEQTERAGQLAYERDEKRRSYELQAIARALAAEIDTYQSSAGGLQEGLERNIKAGKSIPRGAMNRAMEAGPFTATIYPASARLIGQLGEDLAQTVVGFYGLLVPIEDGLRMIGQKPGTALSKDEVDDALRHLKEVITHARACAKALNDFADSLDTKDTPPAAPASDDGAPTG